MGSGRTLTCRIRLHGHAASSDCSPREEFAQDGSDGGGRDPVTPALDGVAAGAGLLDADGNDQSWSSNSVP